MEEQRNMLNIHEVQKKKNNIWEILQEKWPDFFNKIYAKENQGKYIGQM